VEPMLEALKRISDLYHSSATPARTLSAFCCAVLVGRGVTPHPAFDGRPDRGSNGIDPQDVVI